MSEMTTINLVNYIFILIEFEQENCEKWFNIIN